MSRVTNATQPYTAQKTVTTSGTPVQLDSVPIPAGLEVQIKAKDSNTGVITMGNSSANALNSGSNCVRVPAGVAVGWQIENTSNIWIDATVSGEGVEIIAEI